jgi:aryl carrier-like protein
VDFDGVRAIEAAERMKTNKNIKEDFLEMYCAPTLEAVDLICAWLRY